MTPRRKQPTLTDKCASALLALGHIPYNDAKLMTASQIISLYHFDHGMRHAEEGPAVFWNYTPRLIQAHREKTNKIDLPEIAKNKRIIRAFDEHKAAMALKWIIPTQRQEEAMSKPRQKIPQRANPWPAKGTRKVASK